MVEEKAGLEIVPMTIRTAVAAFVGLALLAPMHAGDSKKPASGSYDVQIHAEIVLKDFRRSKTVAVRVYHPKTGGPYPVIVFSHGFGGGKDNFAYLSTYWASHGYVCIHPAHADAGLLKNNLKKGDPALEGLNDPKRWLERVGDIAFVLNSLDDLSDKAAPLKGKIDAKRIGVAGHSFGAYTTMVVGGVTIDLDGMKDNSLADTRVKALLPISPQGAGGMGLTERSWQGLRLPMMTVTGSKDAGVKGQEPDWRKQPYDRSPAGDKYELFFEGANHFSFGGKLGQAHIVDSLEVASLAFWDAYLKGSKKSLDFLQGDGLVNLDKAKLSVRRK
jgi:predicted dienelactone hydrolase